MIVLMEIEVITTLYNDLFLVPFFMNHYRYADKIRVIIDSDTSDGKECESIINTFSNASFEYFKYPNGYNVSMRDNLIFTSYKESTMDWVMLPDSDEFIFCNNMHKFLESQKDDIVRVRFYQAFRNVNDVDLDPSKPVIGQRKYGDPEYVKGKNSHGTKPIILRAGKKIHLMPGGHSIWNWDRHKTSNDVLFGQHWQMADPCFCVERRLSRKKRLMEATLPRGYAFHDLTVNEDFILSECNKHINDKELPL